MGVSNIFRGVKKGMKTGMSLAGGSARIGGTFAKGLFSFASPSSYSRDIRRLTSGVRQFNTLSAQHKSKALRKTAFASASLLGKGSGIVMAARAIGGHNPVKNKKGRFDVPFLPL